MREDLFFEERLNFVHFFFFLRTLPRCVLGVLLYILGPDPFLKTWGFAETSDIYRGPWRYQVREPLL